MLDAAICTVADRGVLFLRPAVNIVVIKHPGEPMRPRTGDMQDTRVGTYTDRSGNLREVRIELPDPAIVRSLRKMTPQQRIESGLRHSVFLRRQARAFLESLHPEWKTEQVNAELARRFLGRRAP